MPFDFSPGTLHVRTGNTKQPTVIFVNTANPVGSYPAADMWHTIDIGKFGVPCTATAVFLSGILLITHGPAQEIAEIRGTFRAPGDQLHHDSYQIQVIEPWIGGGQRSGAALWVPLANGKFEFYWHTNLAGFWPKHSAVGMNLSLQAYVDGAVKNLPP
jgi:hypothetical protein